MELTLMSSAFSFDCKSNLEPFLILGDLKGLFCWGSAVAFLGEAFGTNALDGESKNISFSERQRTYNQASIFSLYSKHTLDRFSQYEGPSIYVPLL